MASNESRSESHSTPEERSQTAVGRRHPSNLNDLEQFAKEEWSKIPVERCKKLITGTDCFQLFCSKGVLPNIKLRVPIIFSSAFFWVLCGIVSDLSFLLCFSVLFQCKPKNKPVSTKTFATATIF